MASYCLLGLLCYLLSALVALVAVIPSAVGCVASCGCIACLLSVLWLLLSLVACRCSDSCRLSLRLLSVTCIQWPPWPPVGTVRRPTNRPTGGGGSFSKRGERLTETRPVPIFMREVKKNVVFQRKTGKIQLETVVFQRKTGENGENLR